MTEAELKQIRGRELNRYIQHKIFPQYLKNDEGHQLRHIRYVIRRSLTFAQQANADAMMAFTVAAYHDLGCSVDREKHEIVSAQMLRDDILLRVYFDKEQIETMAQAIEDHRASCDHEPRSIYGKIISSADRTTNLFDVIRRAYQYRKARMDDPLSDEAIKDAFDHLKRKYNRDGYATKAMYFEDEQYEAMLRKADEIFKDYERFAQMYFLIATEPR